MTAFAWLADRHDPRVQAALTTRCPICKATPGDDCAWPDKPLPDRIVHMMRVPENVLHKEVW